MVPVWSPPSGVVLKPSGAVFGWFLEAPRGSQKLPEAPRSFQTLPEAPRSSQRLPEAPSGSHKPPEAPEAPRGSQRLPEVHRSSQKLQRLPEAPRLGKEEFMVIGPCDSLTPLWFMIGTMVAA